MLFEGFGLAKKKVVKSSAKRKKSAFSDAELVAYCGVNCKDCMARSRRRLELAQMFKASLQELPLDLFKQILPPFRNVDTVVEFLDFLPQLTGTQTCCTSAEQPCGNPQCEIRICVKGKGFRTCAECTDYRTCQKLDFLKPHHATLLSDLDLIKKKGFDNYVDKKVGKYKLKPIRVT